MSRTRNLLDGEYVDVVVRAPNVAVDGVVLGMCPRTAQDFTRCLYRGQASREADGAFRGNMAVRRAFVSSGGDLVVCARASDCMVATDVGGQLVGQSVSIRADGPTPSLSVSPDFGLVEGQTVDVSVGPRPPNLEVHIAQCKPSPGEPFSNCGNWYFDSASVSGEPFTARYTAGRTFRVYDAPSELLTCDVPGECVIYVGPQLTPGTSGVWGATHPIAFAAVGAPRAGSVQIQTPSVTADASVDFVGTEWPESATLSARFCPSNRASLAECATGDPVPIQLPAGGTSFRTSITVLGTIITTIENRYRVTDCTSAPGACEVVVYDVRDPVTAVASAPVTVQPVPRLHGTAALDLNTPLIDNLRVRVIGGGWDPGTVFLPLVCVGSGFDTCHPSPTASVQADGTGVLHAYISLGWTYFGFQPALDCAAEPDRCSLVLADTQRLANAARIPFTVFTGDAIDVPSSYESKYHALIERGVALSGLPPAELQRTSVVVAWWILSASPPSTGLHLPLDGSLSYTTTYTASEYRARSQLAAIFDYTLEELQKTATVTYSWILTGMPEPRPAP